MTSITWHRGIGSDVNARMSIDEQLQAAKLDWEVKTSDIIYGDDTRYVSDYRKAVYRADTGKLLDTASDRWRPFQNRQIVETFHNFCGDFGLSIDHLGCLQDGRTIFAGADLKRQVDIGNVGDIVKARLLLFNYHSVGSGLSVKLHLERLVCLNGMTQSIKVGNRPISHVGQFNTTTVRNLLEATYENFATFGQQANTLAATPMSEAEAQIILIKEFGDPKLPLIEQPRIVQTCLKLFLGEAKGSDMLSAFNTAWGLLNALTEVVNHKSPQRGGVDGHVSSLWNGSKANRQVNFMQTLVRVTSR